MVLRYTMYCKLLTALDEHTHCTLEKRELQNAIYDHYIADGRLVAENFLRDKMVFYPHAQHKRHLSRRSSFRKFMDTTKIYPRRQKSNDVPTPTSATTAHLPCSQKT